MSLIIPLMDCLSFYGLHFMSLSTTLTEHFIDLWGILMCTSIRKYLYHDSCIKYIASLISFNRSPKIIYTYSNKELAKILVFDSLFIYQHAWKITCKCLQWSYLQIRLTDMPDLSDAKFMDEEPMDKQCLTNSKSFICQNISSDKYPDIQLCS